MKIVTALVVISTLFIGCSEKKIQEIPPIPLPVITLEESIIPLEHEFVGKVYGNVDIPIRARVDGYLLGIHFQEGEPVKKGQLLYSIDAQPFDAQLARTLSEVAEAQTGLAKAKSDLERIKPLAQINAVSLADLDGAQAGYDAAVAVLDAAKANERMARIELGYTRISSPINGLIGKSLANLGEYVGKVPNPVILNTVSQTDSLRVEFFITENDYLQLARYDILRKDSQSRRLSDEFRIQLVLSDKTVFDYDGRVQFANREIDQTTGSLLIQTVFPNPNRLIKPGQFAKIRLTITPKDKAIAVPQRAVREFQGKYSVFVVDEKNTISERFVQVSTTYRDMFVIGSGLKPNEKIVLEGLQKIRVGSVINPQITEFKSQTEAQ